jgi:hypothetical protein
VEHARDFWWILSSVQQQNERAIAETGHLIFAWVENPATETDLPADKSTFPATGKQLVGARLSNLAGIGQSQLSKAKSISMFENGFNPPSASRCQPR